tara:strand:- start:390 stop:953 length:564 start_codon:yes stop_codon:yes gene_type:complete
MNKSESIKELATALNKAQAEMSGAKKSAKNPYFKSKYANLEEVINCLKEPFADNGLSFMQFPLSEEGRAGVTTLIMHNSGEWISQDLLLKCAKNDPQGMGSAITYARRYGLQAAAGLPSEDDDGNAATATPKAKAGPKKDQIAQCLRGIKDAPDQAQLNKIVEWAVKKDIAKDIEQAIVAREQELEG